MAESATAPAPSLSSIFNKINHVRHWLMDLSMISMAIGMAATMAGFPVWNILSNFAGMHFQGLIEFPQNLSAFFSGKAAAGSMAGMHMAGGADMAMQAVDHMSSISQPFVSAMEAAEPVMNGFLEKVADNLPISNESLGLWPATH